MQRAETLLKACEGKRFDDRRDTAMIRLLIDTGMRRGGLVGLRVEDVSSGRAPDGGG